MNWKIHVYLPNFSAYRLDYIFRSIDVIFYVYLPELVCTVYLYLFSSSYYCALEIFPSICFFNIYWPNFTCMYICTVCICIYFPVHIFVHWNNSVYRREFFIFGSTQQIYRIFSVSWAEGHRFDSWQTHIFKLTNRKPKYFGTNVFTLFGTENTWHICGKYPLYLRKNYTEMFLWRSTSYSTIKNRRLSQEYNRPGGSDWERRKPADPRRMYLSPTRVQSLPL